ncbi:hypothetical protein FJY90_06545 [Candidatus Gottesmanbacteria bacterium]|nr:hypothetical protein [Candidatus Gottesmanbacteria bacterium]
MLNSDYTRTTITLPEELLLEIKKKALEERKKIKDVIIEGLILSLGINVKKFSKNLTGSFDINSLFGIWGKGPSGRSFVKKVRYSTTEKAREDYLIKLWKKS